MVKIKEQKMAGSPTLRALLAFFVCSVSNAFVLKKSSAAQVKKLRLVKQQKVEATPTGSSLALVDSEDDNCPPCGCNKPNLKKVINYSGSPDAFLQSAKPKCRCDCPPGIIPPTPTHPPAPPLPTHPPAWYMAPCPPWGCPCQFGICIPGVTHPGPKVPEAPPFAKPGLPGGLSASSVTPIGNLPDKKLAPCPATKEAWTRVDRGLAEDANVDQFLPEYVLESTEQKEIIARAADLGLDWAVAKDSEGEEGEDAKKAKKEEAAADFLQIEIIDDPPAEEAAPAEPAPTPEPQPGQGRWYCPFPTATEKTPEELLAINKAREITENKVKSVLEAEEKKKEEEAKAKEEAEKGEGEKEEKKE